MPEAGDDAQCTADPMSDPSNCGTCGHDCGGGDCSKGRCQSVQLVGTRETVLQSRFPFVIDDASLYYFAGSLSAIRACSLSDCRGTDHPWATISWAITAMAIDDSYVYWATDTKTIADSGPADGTISRAKKDGSDRKVIIASLDTIESLTVADGNVYFGPGLDFGPSGVYRCPRDGCSNPFPIATGRTIVGSILSDGQNLFWTEAGGFLATCSTTNGCADMPSVLLANLNSPENVVSDGTLLYVAVSSDPGDQTGSIRKLDKQAKNTTTFVSVPTVDAPTALALDAGYLYWTSVDGGTIHRASVSTGQPETIVTGETRPQNILARNGFIYWARGDGSISRLAE
jgi:hypothetical protein